MVVSLQSRLVAATPRDPAKAGEAFSLFDVVVRRKAPQGAASAVLHTNQVSALPFPSPAAGNTDAVTGATVAAADSAPAGAVAATSDSFGPRTGGGRVARREATATALSIAAASSAVAGAPASPSPRDASAAFSPHAETTSTLLPVACFSSPRPPTLHVAAAEPHDVAAEEEAAAFAWGLQGVVVRTHRDFLDSWEDEDTEETNPRTDEAQVAWQDGTVENIRKDHLQLVDRPLYTGDIICNRRGDRVGLVIDVQQLVDVRLLSRPHREGSGAAAGLAGDGGRSPVAAVGNPSPRGAASSSSTLSATAGDFTAAAAVRRAPSAAVENRCPAAGAGSPSPVAATSSFDSHAACCPLPAAAGGACPRLSRPHTCSSESSAHANTVARGTETAAAVEEAVPPDEPVAAVTGRGGGQGGEREGVEQEREEHGPLDGWPLNSSSRAVAAAGPNTSSMMRSRQDGCCDEERTPCLGVAAGRGGLLEEAAAYLEEATGAGGAAPPVAGAPDAAESENLNEAESAEVLTAAATRGLAGLRRGREGEMRRLVLNSMQQPVKPQQPPSLWSLEAYEAGTVVIRNGWIGCIVSSDMDYLIQLDSGHQFVLEDGMEGVKAQPLQGCLVDAYVMFPSQRVYVTGKWLRNFQHQLEGPQEAEGVGEGAAAAGSHRLCRGVVKSFAVRGVKVSYLVKPGVSWRAAPVDPMATEPTTVDHTELLLVRQQVLRLGEPVYLNVNEASSCRAGAAAGAVAARDAAAAAKTAASAPAGAGAATAADTVTSAAAGAGATAATQSRRTAEATAAPAAAQAGAAAINGVPTLAAAAVVQVAVANEKTSNVTEEKKEHRMEGRDHMLQQRQKEDAARLSQFQQGEQTLENTPVPCCTGPTATSVGSGSLATTAVVQQQQHHLHTDDFVQQERELQKLQEKEQRQQQPDAVPKEGPQLLLRQKQQVQQHQVQQQQVQQQQGAEEHQQQERQRQQAQQLEPVYSLGVVDRLQTTCGVLWEDGEITTACPSRRLLPASVMRVPLGPPDYCLSLAVLPHMFVCRRERRAAAESEQQKQQQQDEKQECGSAADKWWMRPPSYGGLEITAATKPAEELKAVEVVRTLLRLCREMSVTGYHIGLARFAFVRGRGSSSSSSSFEQRQQQRPRREKTSDAGEDASGGEDGGAGGAAAAEDSGATEGSRFHVDGVAARRGPAEQAAATAAGEEGDEAASQLARTTTASGREEEKAAEARHRAPSVATDVSRGVRRVGGDAAGETGTGGRDAAAGGAAALEDGAAEGRREYSRARRRCSVEGNQLEGLTPEGSNSSRGSRAALARAAVVVPTADCSSRTSSFVSAAETERDRCADAGRGGDSTAENRTMTAFRTLYEICRCLQAAAGDSAFGVRFSRRVPALSEAPRRFSSQQQLLEQQQAEREQPHEQDFQGEQQRHRLAGLPSADDAASHAALAEEGAAAADDGRDGAAAAGSAFSCSTGAASAANAQGRARGSDHAAAGAGEEGGSAVHTSSPGAAAPALPLRALDRPEPDDERDGVLDASAAARRLNALMSELFGGPFRKDELFQLLELSRIPGPGLPSLGDAMAEQAGRRNESFFDETQLQNLVDCFSVLRSSDSFSFTRDTSGGCSSFSSSSPSSVSSSSSASASNNSSNVGKSYAEIGLVLRVDRKKNLAHVAWIRDVDAFFARARVLRKKQQKAQQTAARAAGRVRQEDNTGHEEEQQQQLTTSSGQSSDAYRQQNNNCKGRQSLASDQSYSEQISQYYAEAAELCRTAAFAAQTRREAVPTSELCPVSRLLFFPGHVAQLNKALFAACDPFLPSNTAEEKEKEEEEAAAVAAAARAAAAEAAAAAAADAAAGEAQEANWRTEAKLEWERLQMWQQQQQQHKRVQQPQRPGNVGTTYAEEEENSHVFVEILASCGGVVWARSIDGRVAPFSPLELLPINTRWCDPDSPSFESSDDEWVYDDLDSDESSSDDGEDDEDRESESGYGSTDTTDVSDNTRNTLSGCSTPERTERSSSISDA